MKKTAREMLKMPVRNGETDEITSLQDMSGANPTVEQAMTAMQIRQSLDGDTEAFLAVLAAVGDEDGEESEEGRAIMEAAASGDTLAMYKAMRNNIARCIAHTSSDRVASLYNTMLSINDRIEALEAEQRNKRGENPLNVIMFNREQKRKAANV